MNKRQFLKTSGVLITGGVVSRLMSAQQPSAPRTNWAGNYQYSTDRLLLPKSVEEVQQAVKSGHRMRALGARHSFNGIADSTDTQISLKLLDQMALDPKSRTVTVGAGVTYGQLAPYIDGQGFAVHNLASLPHVSVAGACATATHGSGSKNGNLSTAVSGSRNRHRERRGRDPVTAKRRRAVRRGRSCSGRSGRRHQGHARRAAHVPGEAGCVREPLTGASGKPSRRYFLQRLQRQPVHRLAKPSSHTSMDKAPGRTRRLHSNSRPSFMERSLPPRNFIPWPGIPRKVAPNRWASPDPGTSGCRISA